MAAPIGLSTVMSNMEELEFLSSFIHAICWYCVVIAKIAKSGNVINTTMGSQILKCQISKTCTLFTVYFRHTISSDYRMLVIIHKIAGPNPGPFSRRLEMSLCQRSSGWFLFLFFLDIGKNEAAKREKLAPYFICFVQDTLGLWPHCPPLQPLGYAGNLDLYLSRRWCNSRFLCTQLFNSTLLLFLNNWNLLNGAQNSLHLAIMGRTERTGVNRIYAH